MSLKRINPYLWIGLIGLFTIGTSYLIDIYKVFWGRDEIYWTPGSMKLPVEMTTDEFQLFIDEKPLQNHITDRTLYYMDREGVQYTVTENSIGIQLNNWKNEKANILTKAAFTGVAFGVVLTLLVLGLVQNFRTSSKSNK